MCPCFLLPFLGYSFGHAKEEAGCSGVAHHTTRRVKAPSTGMGSRKVLKDLSHPVKFYRTWKTGQAGTGGIPQII